MTPASVLNACLFLTNASIGELASSSRMPNIVKARAKTMYALRHLCGLSYPQIALITGRKDHSTVWTACDRFTQQYSDSAQAWLDEVTSYAEAHPAPPLQTEIQRHAEIRSHIAELAVRLGHRNGDTKPRCPTCGRVLSGKRESQHDRQFPRGHQHTNQEGEWA